MVAPYDIGDPVYSYVRVPGSGSDPTAKNSCCDLSRVSLVAASAPIPQDHVQETPPAAPSNLQPGEKENKVGECTTENVESKTASNTVIKVNTVSNGTQCQDGKPQCMASNGSFIEVRDTPVSNAPNPRKRANPTNDGNAEEQNRPEMPPCKVIRRTSQVAVSSSHNVHANRTDSVGINTATSVRPLSSTGIQTEELLTKVMKQNKELMQRNIMLERQLAVFKDIFRNKDRLAKLVKCLDVPN